MRVRAGIVARLWLRAPRCELELGDEALLLRGSSSEERISVELLEEGLLEREALWSTLRLRLAGMPLLRIRGLARRPARRLLRALQARHATARAAAANRSFEQLLRADEYLSHSDYERWRRDERETLDTVRRMLRGDRERRTGSDTAELRRFERRMEDARTEIDARNDRFVARELERHHELFDRVEHYPLTVRQREVIVRSEDRALVVAGPGSGKTSTVLGKIEYLFAVRKLPAESLLVLSFSKASCEDLRRRLGERATVDPVLRTFHALGRHIVAQVEGEAPSILRAAESREELRKLLGSFANALLRDPEAPTAIRDFLIAHLRDLRSQWEFEDGDAWRRHLGAQDLFTLQGERVKSREELVIANWLFENGVAYQYEAKYEVRTATKTYRQYQPDFYLPDYGIYIEHFGVDREERPAPWIPAESYREGMRWKRDQHRRNGTELVETYSYEYSENVLRTNLAQRLQALGVELRPLSRDALARALEDRGETRRLVHLLASFLDLYKSAGPDLGELRRRADVAGGRAAQFLDLFEAILERYEHYLEAEECIDFHDLVNRAARYVEKGLYEPRFRYVIVDEFQDIAPARHRMLKALVERSPGCRLLAVGDDCQSIYGFTGSDVSIMTGFESHYGFAHRSELDRSFRLNDRMLRLSSRFVLQNPQQIEKRYEAHATTSTPAAVVFGYEPEPGDDSEPARLRDVLGRIQHEASAGTASVLLLGRYRFSAPRELRDLVREHPGLDLSFRTVHQAKGLEADYVIVLGLDADRYGFPCELVDDSLLGLLRGGEETFPDAEERRLFYVALTRARRRAYLLARRSAPSRFITELCGEDYDSLVDGSELDAEILSCPECCGRSLTRRNGRHGPFWRCRSYPDCTGWAPVCDDCGAGALLPAGERYRCSDPACGGSERLCPRCRHGVLRQRSSLYGEFLGCSRFVAIPPCDYTRALPG